METTDKRRIQKIILEFEKRYPFFKKMDVYDIVIHAYKKIHAFLAPMTDNELEEVKNVADRELRLSLF
jgi:hypothetical protein